MSSLLGLGIAFGAQGADETITLRGQFGSFITLGATADEVEMLGPDRVEPATPEDERTVSTWHYFTDRGIRVRVCEDDQRVATVNAGVIPVTEKYVTEAGVRIGDSLKKTTQAYGDRLQLMPESGGTIWFVDHERNNNRITFGFNKGGSMNWIALGALRENGWTCGRLAK
ncbi:MAG: hypothetical protein R3245_08700 [Kiloniellales bacterium]|nr:hypothetical protein [Kiloniellales bacterium]